MTAASSKAKSQDVLVRERRSHWTGQCSARCLSPAPTEPNWQNLLALRVTGDTYADRTIPTLTIAPAAAENSGDSVSRQGSRCIDQATRPNHNTDSPADNKTSSAAASANSAVTSVSFFSNTSRLFSAS